MICNDSNYPELARRMAVQGESALFIPTNNSLPNERASLKVNAVARSRDVALATENQLWVIRADLAGRNGNLTVLDVPRLSIREETWSSKRALGRRTCSWRTSRSKRSASEATRTDDLRDRHCAPESIFVISASASGTKVGFPP